MDFERLTRRELQALCKKNKIPANITNVAMTDALKALSFVEGIEEIMQPSQSETAQSSIESPDRKEVTSPRIPWTGGRTTRRRNAAKEEPETLQPMTRTRRSTRKTLAADADEAKADNTQTPLLVRTTRRACVNSVFRKMDSQLKECEEEEEEKKRDSLATPAPSGVTSRRRGVKEESVVKREYSTRRSVRLAGKKVDVPEVDFFTKEGENVNINIKESLDNVEETSGITGNDANATVEKISEEKEELEVVSAQKHYMQIGEEGDGNAATVDNLEQRGESEHVPADEHAHTGKETEQAATFEEETGQKSEVDNSEQKEKLEVVSAQKHYIQIGEEGDNAATVDNLERKGESEHVPAEEHAHTGKETEQAATFEEETGQKSEVHGQKLEGDSINVNTGVDENSEGNSEQKEELEVVSAQKHYMQIGEEGDDNAATVDNLEGKGESEDVQAEEHAHTGKEIEQAATFEEETGQKSEVDDQKLDGEGINVNTGVDKNSEGNDEVEVDSVKELKTTVEEEGEGNFETDMVTLKGDMEEAKNVENETDCFVFETEVEVDERNGENTAHERALDVCNFETETSAEITEQSDNGKEAGFEEKACDIVENFEHETEDKSVVDLSVDTEIMEKEISEDKDMEFKQLPALNANEVVLEISANIAANMHGDVVENELNLDKSPKSMIVEAKEHGNDVVYQVTNSKKDMPSAGSDSDLLFKPTSLTPYKVSATKASPMMETIMSDNKENIDSGSKIILPKERVKVAIAKNTNENVKKYDDVSVRKLTKMLKKKLQITNKLSKNENENENEVRSGRLALQALPENQLVDETHNMTYFHDKR